MWDRRPRLSHAVCPRRNDRPAACPTLWDRRPRLSEFIPLLCRRLQYGTAATGCVNFPHSRFNLRPLESQSQLEIRRPRRGAACCAQEIQIQGADPCVRPKCRGMACTVPAFSPSTVCGLPSTGRMEGAALSGARLRPAPVYRDRIPGDPGGFVGGQKQDQLRGFLRFAHAAQGMGLLGVL